MGLPGSCATDPSRRRGSYSPPRLSLLSAQAQTTSVGSSGDTLITPAVPSISFFWSTYDDNVQTIPQCAGFQVQTYNNTGAMVQPTAPYYFTAFPIDYEPAATAVGNAGIGQWFTWSAAYPVVSAESSSNGMCGKETLSSYGGVSTGHTPVPRHDRFGWEFWRHR